MPDNKVQSPIMDPNAIASSLTNNWLLKILKNVEKITKVRNKKKPEKNSKLN